MSILPYPRFFRSLAALGVVLFVATVSIANAAHVDPPGRVARLNHVEGDVSYSPAGEDQWLGIVRNRPLVRGDRLWTDRDARVELQIGSAAIRLGSDTSFEILDLSDRIAQVQITQGSINLRVRRLYRGQLLEVATPTLAFSINRPGRYRIDVDPDYEETTIVVWEGAGEAYGEDASFPLSAGDTVRFYDANLRDYEMFGLPRADEFDHYALDRDARLDQSVSLRYLDDDVVGYADLDEYGSWRATRAYGNVWFPNRVDTDWAPYRDGHWVWQEPWGWTWVDNAPWGFAPSHYGRWVSLSNRWGWIPGPRNVRAIYAPALVAFVGGRNWSASISLGGGSPIGWFPLGPREVYVPSYQASRDYFTRVNVNNTVINNTTITNIYNNYSTGNTNVTQLAYANRAVAGAVTAVPSDVFANARSVRQSALRLDRTAYSTGEVMGVAPVAPSMRSVLGAGRASKVRPERAAFDRQVIARNAPPPGEIPFAMREKQLQRNPGKALEQRTERSASRTGDASQNVRVIAEQRSAPNARKSGSVREGVEPEASAAQPGQLQPLDRASERQNGRDRQPAERGRNQERKTQDDVQPQDVPSEAADQQRAERQRQGEARQLERRQRDDAAQQQALKQQQTQQEQQAAEQQRITRQRDQNQRQADVQQQAQQQQAQRDQQAQQQQAQQQMQREQQAEQEQQTRRSREAQRAQQDARQRDIDAQQQMQRAQQAEQENQAQRAREAEKTQQETAQRQAAERLQLEQQSTQNEQQVLHIARQQAQQQAEAERAARKGEETAAPEEEASDETKKDKRPKPQRDRRGDKDEDQNAAGVMIQD